MHVPCTVVFSITMQLYLDLCNIHVYHFIIYLFNTTTRTMKLAQSVAIVTGGARGLGRAFTEELLKRGARVC